MKPAILCLSLLAMSRVLLAVDGLMELPDQCVYVKDGLYLKVAMVENAKAFLEQWGRSGRGGDGGALQTKTVFRRGDVVFPAIMYSTNALTAEGHADVVFDLLFRRPDGSIYEHMKELTVVKGVPPKGVGLSEAKGALKIEPTDPLGEYTMKVSITDKVRMETVEMLFHFTVADEASAAPPAEEASPTPTPFHSSRVRSSLDGR